MKSNNALHSIQYRRFGFLAVLLPSPLKKTEKMAKVLNDQREKLFKELREKWKTTQIEEMPTRKE